MSLSRTALSRRTLLASTALLAAAGRAQAAEPILLAVSGPLTGSNAHYGAQWKDGFELALDDFGRTIGDRPLQYVFEDRQSDPRQAVALAQKFVADKRYVMELGDFASPASMAASPIYQRAGMVQFGFTNSHPDFTKGGTYMWSTSISQADEQPKLAEFAIEAMGFKKIALIHLNTDWGRTSKDLFIPAAKALGGEVVAAEAFLPDERDFRPTLVRVRDSKPDALVIIAYYADAALIARQARDQGLTQQIIGVSSVYSPKLIELGGAAVEGMVTHSPFSSVDPRPEVQSFVKRFEAKYNREPDAFNVYAYDAMAVAYAVIKQYGAERKAIRDGLEKIKDVPSVIFGKATFDPATRRIAKPRYARLIVKGGKFVSWDGPTKAS
jgi:branched-chain amino acid transport system substrate-binding protein